MVANDGFLTHDLIKGRLRLVPLVLPFNPGGDSFKNDLGMFSVYAYGWMIADRGRTDAYCRALRECIKDGAVVIDIGTGLGIWALSACRLGARKVYAVESSNVIELAQQIAADNNCEDRIEFIHDLSTRLTLPERADVIVSDVHGVLPFFQQTLPSLIDARHRFLKPGGVMIPQVETLWGTIVENPEEYGGYFDAWKEDGHGFNLQAARRVATNGYGKAIFKPEQLLFEPALIATLDYSCLETPNLRGRLESTIGRAGTAHGLGVWFNSELAPGILMSNAPGGPTLIYGNAFFPLSEPVTVAEGDTVSCDLRADLVADDYVWTWETMINRKSRPSEPIVFRQSTFFNEVYNSRQLQKLSSGHVPVLNEEGLARRFIMEKMNGELSLEAIARELMANFPKNFPTLRESLNHVTMLSKQYSR